MGITPKTGCRGKSFWGLGLEGLGFKDLRFWCRVQTINPKPEILKPE